MAASSSERLWRSISSPRVSLMYAMARWMICRLTSPRKSIFSKPRLAISSMANWVTAMPLSLVSLGRARGT